MVVYLLEFFKIVLIRCCQNAPLNLFSLHELELCHREEYRILCGVFIHGSHFSRSDYELSKEFVQEFFDKRKAGSDKFFLITARLFVQLQCR